VFQLQHKHLCGIGVGSAFDADSHNCRAATLNTVSTPLRDSYPATIMPLPRCRIPIRTVAGLIEIAATNRIAMFSDRVIELVRSKG